MSGTMRTEVQPVAAEALVNDRDWSAVEEHYLSTAPYNYAVVDDFLAPEPCLAVREKILANKGWAYMNWNAKELFIRNFELAEVRMIASYLKTKMPRILGQLELVQHIAFLHQRNAGLCAHSDTGLITADLWLTPDECNLDKESGGLVLYDVKREPNMMIHEFNAAPWCLEYLERNTKGGQVKIGYRYNRLVLFDARTFHASDKICFNTKGPQTYRINYALLFDNTGEFTDRYDQYGDGIGTRRQKHS